MIDAVFSCIGSTAFLFMTTQELVRERAHRNYEGNLRFEEMTDIAERLGYPIDTTIHYEMRGGAAYALSDTVSRPFHSQTLLAMQRGTELFTGDQAFEAERLRVEHEEALLVDAFGRGELDGDVLVKFSKVPDAVVQGDTGISGYRRDLLRSFVRLYYRADDGTIACRFFSLDRNSQQGVAAIGDLLGIDTLQQSEQVLAASNVIDTQGMRPDDYVDELVARVKLVYDDAHCRETGERSYAGSIYVDQRNALQEVVSHAHLVSEHMAVIAEIARQGRGEAVLEAERQKVAAAIKLASQGHRVDSVGDASVAVAVESGNYGRECATAQTGMNQSQEMNTQENIWRHGECQVCFARTMVGSCAVCALCAAADDRGEDLLRLREQNLKRRTQKQAVAKRALRPVSDWQPLRRYRTQPQKKQQDRARTRSTIVIGGTRVEYYDETSGEFVLVA